MSHPAFSCSPMKNSLFFPLALATLLPMSACNAAPRAALVAASPAPSAPRALPVAASPASTANLLSQNPDFETPGGFGGGHGVTSSVPGWEADYFSYDGFGVTDGEASSGKRYLNLNHGGRVSTAKENRVDVSPNRLYRMEFDARKFSETNPGALDGFVPSIQFFDAKGDLIRDAKGMEMGTSGATPWQHYSLEKVAPMGAVKAGVQVILSRGNYPNEDKHVAWVDNFSLRVVAEPGNVINVRRAPHALTPGGVAHLEVKMAAKTTCSLTARLMLNERPVAQAGAIVPIGRSLVSLDVPLPANLKTSNAYSWEVEAMPFPFLNGPRSTGMGLFPSQKITQVFVDPTQTGSGIIPADNPDLLYAGRFDKTDPKNPVMYWGGSQVLARFAGTSVKANIRAGDGAQYLAVIDGDEEHEIKTQVSGGVLPIATGLKDGIHSLVLLKNSEAQGGETFGGLVLDAGKGLLRPEPLSPHRIEFFGDSITSGGIPDAKRDKSNPNEDGDYDGNYNHTYAAFTANALNADWRPISRGGTGVSGSWVFDYTLRDYWNKLDFDGFNAKTAPPYDQAQWQPQAIVVAIGHNDQFRKPSDQAFVDAYAGFIADLHRVYPRAEIFCTNTSMSGGDGYLWKLALLPLVQDDPRLHFQLFTPGQGHGGHPRLNDHRDMALGNRDWNSLAEWIGDTMGW